MGSRSPELSQKHMEFIQNQKMFFVATTAANCKINLSPKGMGGFKVIDENTVIWLNYTGSGNETAAHLLVDDRMTVMFCAFEGSALILRLYGIAHSVHPRDDMWSLYINQFDEPKGARQILVMHVNTVQTSCGGGVPLYEYQGERSDLTDWFDTKGEEGILEYQKKKNQVSIDGLKTGLFVDE